MPSISDTAKQRKANIKATGGMPPKPQKPLMSQDAKNIKIRQGYESIPEAEIKRGKR